jgi:chaperonin cofactor prefoldin
MMRVDDLAKLKADLKEEQETRELRTKTLKTQIDKLEAQLKEMQTQLTPVLQRLQGPGGPGAGS